MADARPAISSDCAQWLGSATSFGIFSTPLPFGLAALFGFHLNYPVRFFNNAN